MKKLILVFILMAASLATWAQTPRVDTVAVMILNRMADVIGQLNSCTFTLNTSVDVADPDYGIVKQFNEDEVILVGPDKMLIHAYGDKGHRGFWYNGCQLVFYSFDENNYAIVDVPPTIIETIDTVNKTYGIDFPAADIFYPTFTDDILANFDNLVFLGKKVLDDQECFYVLASNNNMSVQFWIANDAYNLPMKFIITYKNDGNKQYEATFSNWQLNPEIPEAVFEFLPPPAAAKIILMPK
jgi:hypothetical protein